MVKAVTEAIIQGWTDHDSNQGISSTSDVERFLLDIPAELYVSQTDEPYVFEEEGKWELREQQPEVFQEVLVVA